MKTLFIEARYEGRMRLPEECARVLPKRICLASTVQFVGSLSGIKRQLEEQGKKVFLFKGTHARYPGQVLGCSKILNREDFDAFLYIGDGVFHPKELLLQSDKKVFVFNPFSKKFFKMGQEDVKKIKNKIKGSLIKFLSSSNIGVIITTKPGQMRLKQALALKEKYKDKNFYFLLFDTIDFQQLENFPFIECFVNTACPRIALDDSIRMEKPIIDVDYLSNYKVVTK